MWLLNNIVVNFKKGATIGTFLFLFFVNLSAGDFLYDDKKSIENLEEVKSQIENTNDEHLLTFKKNDFEAYFAGESKTEYLCYKDMSFLNNEIPGEFGYFKETIDFIFNIAYGQKKYGHKAFEFHSDLRSKQKWGIVGNYRNTSPVEIKLNEVSLGEHEHKSSRPVPWFKEAWMQFSFNSVLGIDSKKIHNFKLGWFPFHFGRGIGFGPFYATVYEEFGLFSYPSEAGAPGININGELIKDKLSYDLYYSKLEDKSAWISDIFNTVKLHHVAGVPWRGVAKDDELWAARLKAKIEGEKLGKLEFEPYIYFNEASDQEVEVKNDTKTKLGAYGLALEYQKGNFECGGEVAFNYGSEKLYNIDRNKIEITRDENGYLGEQYTYVLDADSKNVWRTSDNRQIVELSNNYTNGSEIEIGSGIYNSDNRFRPQFKNKFNGWMAVVDAAYTIKNWNLKFGTEYIYASGDVNPHDSEVDKSYKGFVGLHELYTGNKVKSAIIGGERSIMIPESLPAGKREVRDKFRARNNSTLTDMHIFGFSVTWSPERLKKRKFELNPNILFFWKDHDSYKYIIDLSDESNNGTSDTEKAKKFIGTEINLNASYNLLKDLTLKGTIAMFFPGGFYHDVKGVPIKKDFYLDSLTLEQRQRYGINSSNIENYRLGTDNAIFGKIILLYKF
ncbi:hypothetical protein KAT08_00800 [Candidatus Babeliales bacterium]|nr:hypothetical protein [Candidatus Babeliales bacterium]